MVAGVLAVLAALGTGFYTMMLMQTRSAIRYSDSVRADMMSRAGIEFSISHLRAQALKKTEDPSDPWYMVDYLNGGKRYVSFPDTASNVDGGFLYDNIDNDTDGVIDNRGEARLDSNVKGYSSSMSSSAGAGSDTFSLQITDAASRINVNACDNLAVVLDNLCRVIGAPLVAANQDKLTPRVWEWYGGTQWPNYLTGAVTDWPKSGTPGGPPGAVDRDIYFTLGPDKRPLQDLTVGTPTAGTAVFGDGYAIAGYRAKHGRFRSLEEVKEALTYVKRPTSPELERLEREVKFAVLRDYITVDSWVDTTTVCVGKFEWVWSDTSDSAIAIDRDKSWIPSVDAAGKRYDDASNKRGSLIGCYVSIINGHGAGQLRRIKDNGIDWIQIDKGFVVPPGPTSSYMIIAKEDALLDADGFPLTNPDGTLKDDPNIDYSNRPLCIHRAPININTASDKVLAALFMGINVTHGNFMSIGTDADIRKLAPMKSRYAWAPTDPDWLIKDFDDPARVYRTVVPYVITPKGLKRIPADPGKLVIDRPAPWPAIDEDRFGYIYNYKNLGTPNFVVANDKSGKPGVVNDAHELAYRILVARQNDSSAPTLKWIDPKSGNANAVPNTSFERKPFKNWDDFYFRVVRPWDDSRLDPASPAYDPGAASVARLIMAHFNSNTNILKFNPNIEWIDRWGRNFTEMEPVMVYTNQQETKSGMSEGGHGEIDGTGSVSTCDMDGAMNPNAVPIFSRERIGWVGGGPYFVCGIFGTDPRWMGSYVTRSFRYKSDELIDKTDMNRSTTEFAFDSRGIFEIQSTGTIAKKGEVLAERKIAALVKVYDVWSESSQRQFVQGFISRASGNPGTPQSGTVTKDCSNINSRLALVTHPEPLVPDLYRINNAKNKEIVDTTSSPDKKRDAYSMVSLPGGKEWDINVPDVIANRVLPALYDGSITLATNTLRYDSSDAGDSDSFLASFNGDLDTDTCNGNGREQAKSPLNCKVRVIDTMGLLGILNDTQIDTDPGLKGDSSSSTAFVVPDLSPYSGTPLDIYRYQSVRNGLRGLRAEFFWNNVTCRQGDLRPEGVYITGSGIAGNDGVIKYLCGHDDPANYDNQNFNLNGRGATRVTGEGAGGDPGDIQGSLVTMWAKTTWHHNDNRAHEFFDCTSPGWNDAGIRAEAWWLRKQGGPQWAVCEGGSLPNGLVPYEDSTWGTSGAGNRVNDFSLLMEPHQDSGDQSDPDWCMYLHGGSSGVPPTRTDKTRFAATYQPESPAYRVQPFRWQFLGARVFLKQDFASCNNSVAGLTSPGGAGGAGKSGYMKAQQSPDGWADTNSLWCTQNLFRPFIDSERWSDGPDYKPFAKYWVVHQQQGSTGFRRYQSKGRAGPIAGSADGGQPVRYAWAHPGGYATNTDNRGVSGIENHTIFGMNNCNPGRGYKNGNNGTFTSIYRGTPEEGTYAVIDELKISRKETILRNPPNRADDRVTRDDNSKPGEMTCSRYYLPQNPASRDECPTFTSQTMLQSLKSADKKTSTNPEYVTLARVTWNAFTPRFMHENKRFKFSRNEAITKRGGYQGNVDNAGAVATENVDYRGPFNYRIYNDLNDKDAGKLETPMDYGDSSYDSAMAIIPYRCARPTPAQYQTLAPYNADNNYHATRGIEVELLQDDDAIPDNGGGIVLGVGGTFTNPDVLNKIVDGVGNPIKVRTDRLRYRVRFRFPVDTLADPSSPGKPWVDPATQYLLDTPVFEDISITYFTKPRILDYREITE